MREIKKKQTSEEKLNSRKRNRDEDKCPSAPKLTPRTPIQDERSTPPPLLLNATAPLQISLRTGSIFQSVSKRLKTGAEHELIGVENKLESLKLDDESTMTTPQS